MVTYLNILFGTLILCGENPKTKQNKSKRNKQTSKQKKERGKSSGQIADIRLVLFLGSIASVIKARDIIGSFL